VIDYVPIGLQLVFATLLAGVILGLSSLVSRRPKSRTDLSPYECGVDLLEPGGKRYTIRFYMVAMLFILFDIEAAFLYPWAVIYRDATRTSSALAWFVFGEMLLFILLLAVGYIYVWKKRAFDWK